jgi:hypothetical protein
MQVKTFMTWRMKASPAKSTETSVLKKRSRDEAGDVSQSTSSLPPPLAPIYRRS